MKPDKYLSVSQLELFERDYSAWKDHYIDGNPTPTSKEMTLGSAVHAGIEAYWLGEGEPVRAYEDYLTEHVLEIPADCFEGIKAQGYGLLTCYLTQIAPDLTLWPVDPPASATEWEFTVPVDGCNRPLYGKADLLTQEDGLPVIRDVKTLKTPWSKNKVAKSLQRVAYWYAVRELLGLEPKRFVLDFIVKEDPPRIVSHEATVVTDAEIDDMIARFQKLDAEYAAYEREVSNAQAS